MRQRPLSVLLASTIALISACSGGSSGMTDVTVLGYTVAIRTAPPASAQVGSSVPIAFTVTENESDGSTKPASGKSFTVAAMSGGGTVNGAASSTLTTAADGSVAFNWLLGSTAGTQTLRGSLSAANFIDVSVVTTLPPATQLGFVAVPSATAQSGVALVSQPTVQLKDAAGANVAQAAVPVTVSIDVGSGVLGGGPLTANTNASGIATFSGLTITGLTGARTLKFAATLNSGTVNLTSIVTVSAGVASQMILSTQPSTTTQNGIAFPQQPIVQLQDLSGNPVAQAGVPVTVAIDAGGGTLGGILTVNTNAGGAAVFSGLAIAGSTGNRTLRFSATINGAAAIQTATVAVTAGIASKLVLTTPPSATVQSGVLFAQQPIAQVQDVSGNAVAQAGVPVSISIDVGSGTLGGVLTVISNANGSAAFSGLFIAGVAGARTLRFTAVLGSQTTSVTAGIAILPDAASQLTMKTQPPAIAGIGLLLSPAPQVQLRDPSGAAVAQAGVVVTASIAAGTTPLRGVLTATTDANGVATFGNLVFLNVVGSASLRFSATLPGTGLTSVISEFVQIALAGNGKIVFKKDKDALWVVNPDGTGLTQLTPGYGLAACQRGDEHPRWSPDGTRIAFTRTENDRVEIWTMHADGSNQTRLTFTASAGSGCADTPQRTYNQFPTWSPDGTKILFTSDQSVATDDQDLWIMNADGTNQRKLFGSSSDGEGNAAYSPDGSTIAFTLTIKTASVCEGASGGSELWLLDGDGTNPRLLTTAPTATNNTQCSLESWPSWSPDAQQIFLSINKFTLPCTEEIVSIASNPNVSARVQHTSCFQGNGSHRPSYSPDGTRVVFKTFASSGALWTMRADGTQRTLLTVGSGNALRIDDAHWQSIAPQAATLVRSPQR